MRCEDQGRNGYGSTLKTMRALHTGKTSLLQNEGRKKWVFSVFPNVIKYTTKMRQRGREKGGPTIKFIKLLANNHQVQ